MSTGIIVCGAAGRMGRRIIALAGEHADAHVAAALEVPGNPCVGRDAGEIAGVGNLDIAIGDDLSAALSPGRVIVDFSTADAALEHLREAAGAGIASVIGATGLSEEQKREADELSKNAPTLIAPNMSVGVNVLLALVEDAVRRLGDGFDCEIVELHHNQKKDAPSGTALALAAAAARGAAGTAPEKTLVLSREGMTGARKKSEIGVVALRGGDAAGEHTVMLVGTGERIELVHRAASRDCFAQGAVEAAVWLAGKGPGLYSMKDVIGTSAA
jgi:4-hydroxy-tetrahydrodipicolinate reductase